MGYLDTYPYGCSEQITSKIYPLMLLSTISSGYNNQEVEDKYNCVIKELEKFQRGIKRFSLWQDGDYIDNFASIYIMQFFTDMKEMKFCSK